MRSPTLQEAASALGLTITAQQERALLTYLEQLQGWNRTYNLTAIRDPQQMLVQHVFDSMAVVQPLRQHPWRAPVHVLDAGSGAGLPGVVLALLQPHWHITCVDAVEKKVVFIQQVARSIGLHNVTALHARLERARLSADLPPVTFAISRAFAALADFARLTQGLLGAQQDDDTLVAMKGKVPHDEMVALERASDWRVSKVEALSVPHLEADRCLVWLQRPTQHKEPHAPG